jgi:hypothetical protein
MMFDRQAQDPLDVTVASSQAPTIHTQEGDKDSSEEEDDKEEQDMDVDSTATKKLGNQATFMSLRWASNCWQAPLMQRQPWVR